MIETVPDEAAEIMPGRETADLSRPLEVATTAMTRGCTRSASASPIRPPPMTHRIHPVIAHHSQLRARRCQAMVRDRPFIEAHPRADPEQALAECHVRHPPHDVLVALRAEGLIRNELDLRVAGRPRQPVDPPCEVEDVTSSVLPMLMTSPTDSGRRVAW